MRKILSLIIIIFAPTLVYGLEGECIRTDAMGITQTTACYVTPRLYRTKIFKILLCWQAPAPLYVDRGTLVPDGTTLDLSSCTGVVFDSAEGQVFDLAINSQNSIPNVHLSSIDSKTEYSHAVIIASNVLAIKASEKFATNRNGSGSSVGNYCWTKAMDIRQSQIERVSNGTLSFYSNRDEWGTICDTSEGTPGFFSVNIDNMGNKIDGDEYWGNVYFRAASIDSNNKINANSVNNTRLALVSQLEKRLKMGGINKLDIKLKVTNSVEVNQISSGRAMPAFLPAPYSITITAM